MSKTGNGDEILSLLPQKQSSVLTRSIQSTEYCVYLHGAIGEPQQWYEHYTVYKSAGPDDIIKLYINSPGGNMATAVEYISHMQQCNAPIMAIIGMDCASAATAIALAADGWETSPFSTFLVHGFSYGLGGNAAHVANHASFNTRLNERFIREIYGSFLTDEEVADILKGVDVLIDSDDLNKRLQKISEEKDVEENEQTQ